MNVTAYPWPSEESQGFQAFYDFHGRKVTLKIFEVPDDAFYFQCETCGWISQPLQDPLIDPTRSAADRNNLFALDVHACEHLERTPML